ncbi:hypothetical protein GOBAR_AA38662 [Gossypium barbadense]|uniref:Uncharacterized protein n=1 Tax=Gossypium barbadense TaxID=3634 RepID=A0A2P5VTC0_GOSBA|nr:hypothetical protein GOBAR_AA38662 [Gossypium barbadense]
MGLVVVPIKVDLYRALLGKVLNKFEGGWILINWWNHGSSYVGLPEDMEDFRQGVTAIRVEAMNFAATTRPGRVTQSGHAGKERRRLGEVAQGAYRGLGALTGKPYLLLLKRGEAKFGARNNNDHHSSNIIGDAVA